MALNIKNIFSISNSFVVLHSTKTSVMGAIGSTRDMSKHYDPKFKWHRMKKVIKPVSNEGEDHRDYLKKHGFIPFSPYRDMPIFINSSPEVIDPYVPVKGDGKFSLLREKGISGLKESVTQAGSSFRAMRTIKKYLKDFDLDQFPSLAQDIYINAHLALAKNNFEELQKYATLRAINTMWNNVKQRTIRWKFIESLEPPKAVQSRAQSIAYDENYVAQVTVRFHTKQMLAIYDRFGRLMYGSEILAKDVLEYVVFENHLVNLYGIWKIHDKIIPDWLPPKEPLPKTFREPVRTEETEEEKEEEQDNFLIENVD